MSDKAYTILLTSNASTQVKTITISKAWVRAGLFFFALFLILLMAFAFDYVKVLSEVNQQSGLRSENILLKQKFKLLEDKVSSLENSLHRVKKYSEKIKSVASWASKEKLKVKKTPTIKPEEKGPFRLASVSPFKSLLQVSPFFKKAPLDRSEKNSGDAESKINEITIRLNKVATHSNLEEQNMMTLWESLSQKKIMLDSTPNRKPVVGGWYTSKFGYRTDPFSGASVMHSGLDIAASPGTPVYAPADGIVSYVSYEEGYGNLVTIDHGYGVKTRYAHNSEIHVSRGQKVKRGELISSVGSTGRSSGSHLHYEVRLNGIAVDPMNYIVELY